MLDVLLAIGGAIVRGWMVLVDFLTVLDLVRGPRDKRVKVPNAPLPAAAERALTEAEERRKNDPGFFDRYGGPDQKRTT